MTEPENDRAREHPSPTITESENGEPENSRARESPNPSFSGSVHAYQEKEHRKLYQKPYLDSDTTPKSLVAWYPYTVQSYTRRF